MILKGNTILQELGSYDNMFEERHLADEYTSSSLTQLVSLERGKEERGRNERQKAAPVSKRMSSLELRQI